MRLVYCKKHSNSRNINCATLNIVEFVPSPKEIYLKGEPRNVKTALVRMWFQLMTFGKAKLLCVFNENGEAIHTSYIVPKCLKFSFLNDGDYIIGPCYTNPDYRGKGIYPKVLQYISSSVGCSNTVFYMCVDDGNLSSIKGIEKAGFEKIGTVKKTRILKRYCLQ